MEIDDKSNVMEKNSDELKVTVNEWLNYFQLQRKILADGNNINLLLFYVIGLFFIVCLIIILYQSTYFLAAFFGLIISIILLAINCYSRFNTENVMLDIDKITLKILMGELTNSADILIEMNKSFKKK